MGFDSAIRALTHPVVRRLFRPIMRNRATIFMLHRLNAPEHDIRGHSAEFVCNALHELSQSGAHFVSVRSIIERWNAGLEIGPDEIAFTFDDGFADQAQLLRQAFVPVGCPATVFLITDFLDGKLWPWDDQIGYIIRHTTRPTATLAFGGRQLSLDLRSVAARQKAVEQVRERCKKTSNSDLYAQLRDVAAQLDVELPQEPPAEYRPMAWNEVRSLAAQNIDFGPHSMTHRILSRLSSQEAQREIAGSWARLKQELDNPLPVFAWPTGRRSDYERKDIEIARHIGLQASMATDDDYSYVPKRGDRDDLFKIKRFALPDSTQGVLRYGSWIERGRQLLPV